MKISLVVGARPNFMKASPILDALGLHNKTSNRKIDHILVHTGQHYDERLSSLFFRDLSMKMPDVNLGVGSGSHAIQTAEIMKRFEDVCVYQRPTHVLVVGDVNSTIACALVAAKIGIAVIHVEAGLRSFDRTMPEEVNRILTDAISDVLFTTESSANINLANEGIPESRVHFVGNVMVDTLLKHLEKARESTILHKLGLSGKEEGRLGKYALVTLHRPSNVDVRVVFTQIAQALKAVSQELPIVFPVHPRTRNRMREYGLEDMFVCKESIQPITGKGVYCIEPLGYLDFLRLMANAALVLTDSGGIQEETTILGVRCITLRESTERPVTITNGTNTLCGTDCDQIINMSFSHLRNLVGDQGSIHLMDMDKRACGHPPLWDGKASERIVRVLANMI
jgi:UDP-N-acetylglucosamine 2-epimerase (non-hydrolysing)